MDFKVIFPSGYQVTDLLDDNIDINIITEYGDVYFATLFTVSNVSHLMYKDSTDWFWATDMIIVKDLSQPTIRQSIEQMIKVDYLDSACTKIATLQFKFTGKSFSGIADMANGFDINDD